MRQKMKKWICISLFLMLLAMTAAPMTTKAAESLKLSKSSVTLCTGRAYRLKTNTAKTVTWGSLKTSVAVVNTSGKVYAKNPGTAYITAQCGKEKVKCKVIVKDHEWKKIASKNATCTEKGCKKYQCQRCETTKTISIPVLKHKWVTQKVTIHHKEKGHYEYSFGHKKVRWVLCDCGMKLYDTELQPLEDHLAEPPWENEEGEKYEHYYRLYGEDYIPEVKKTWWVDVPAYDETAKETVCSLCGKKK